MGTGYMDAMRLLPCLKLVISHISNWNVNYQPKCKLVFFSSWDCIISYNKQSKGEESDILVEDKIFFTGLVYWATVTGNAVGRSTGHDYNNALRPTALVGLVKNACFVCLFDGGLVWLILWYKSEKCMIFQ